MLAAPPPAAKDEGEQVTREDSHRAASLSSVPLPAGERHRLRPAGGTHTEARRGLKC